MKKFLLLILFMSVSTFAVGGDTLEYDAGVEAVADGDTMYTAIFYHPLKDSIQSIINGRLGNVNIAADANIALTKLDTSTTLSKLKVDSIISDVLTSGRVDTDTIGSSPYIEGIATLDTIRGNPDIDSVSGGTIFSGTITAPVLVTDSIKRTGVDDDNIVLENDKTVFNNGGATSFVFEDDKAYSDLRNFGLGTINLKTWNSDYLNIGIGGMAAIWADKALSTTAAFVLSNNLYFDGSFKRYINAASSLYQIGNLGIHTWIGDTATGDIGAYTPTTRMTLDAVGNLTLATGDLTLTSGTLSAPAFSFDTMSADFLQIGGGAFLDTYEEGTFACSLSVVLHEQVGTANYTRIGNLVTIALPGLNDTLDAGTYYGITIKGLPASLRPSAFTTTVPGVSIYENGSEVNGLFSISTSGIAMRKVDGTQFTNVNNCGVGSLTSQNQRTVFTYYLWN